MIYKEKEAKGINFEAKVSLILGDLANQNGWYLLEDVHLDSNSIRGYTQIDFVLFTRNKYYCIEAKDWECEIEPTESRYWKIYYNRVITVLNPVEQNRNHLLKLKRYIQSAKLDSAVCFSNSVIMKQKINGVYYLEDFIKMLNKDISKIQVISEEDMYRDYKIIKEESLKVKIRSIEL